MPIRDDGDIFCVAAVCFDDTRPKVSFGGKMREWVAMLQKYSASIFAVYVKPKQGYEAAVEARFTYMNILRRMACEKNNDASLCEIRPRNAVWTFCMTQGITHSIGYSVTRGEIDQISIALDEKTMSDTDRALFRGSVFRGPGVLREVMNDPDAPDPLAAQVLRTRLDIPPEAISLAWSDEPESSWMRDGLILADLVATHTRLEILKSPATPLSGHLREADVPYEVIDLTEKLMAPVNPEAIKDWERNTGLRAPRPDQE
jgi:hypothetical protein